MKHENVQEYYGKTLQSSADLQTNACCEPAEMPGWLKKSVAQLHDEVLMRYYGCGLIAPEALKGARVLDLGCGAGRDVYALSQMVGEEGFVVGVDMTDEQLDVARSLSRLSSAGVRTIARQMLRFTKDTLKIWKICRWILRSVSTSLSPIAWSILRRISKRYCAEPMSLLKPGGEMYFSDVYADRRVPEAMARDEVLYGECLSGALYWNDFLKFAKLAGFTDPRLVTHRPITIENPVLEAAVAPLQFTSPPIVYGNWRIWKVIVRTTGRR